MYTRKKVTKIYRKQLVFHCSKTQGLVQRILKVKDEMQRLRI